MKPIETTGTEPRRTAPCVILLTITITAVLVGCGGRSGESAPASPQITPVRAADTFVGRTSCVECHEPEVRAWIGSHHDLAMDVVSEDSVLGDFDDATFHSGGVTSSFARRDGAYVVRTDGPDGELRDYEVSYVFGVAPLQQYLVAFPGGRYQVLPLCWDTRPAAEGGQRWFHLYPDEHIDHADPLHWTGIRQNWNHVCAECHSTNLRKRYDLKADAYDTVWEEIDVSCEACHGPASGHLAWARGADGDDRAGAPPNHGFAVGLRNVDAGVWVPDLESGTAKRSVPRHTHAQIETCARCHARRTQIASDYVHGRPVLDTHLVSLLDENLYHPDGQILDEVYVYGSFLQSKMFGAGVTCNDCHDSHGLQLHAPGNAVCSKCHHADRFDTPLHSFHESGPAGANCVDCHMPETTYMVVDPRRDHSIRIPRPDLSGTLGTPNACNACHDEKTAQWAANAIAKWYGPERRAEPHFGAAIHAGRTGMPGAERALITLARDDEQPGIARATAITLLGRYPGLDALAVADATLGDDDPLVRFAAIRAIAMASPADRLRLAAPRLDDPVRAVRHEAANVMASVPLEMMSTEQREATNRAIEEFVDAQLASADRPEAHLNIGVVRTLRGRFADAEASYRTAMRLAPADAAAYVNLADLYRGTGRDIEGERTLRHALGVVHEPAAIHHALGLTLVRLGRIDEAVEHMGHAARLAPNDARLGYVYAIALNSIRASAEAIGQLERSLERHPYDRDILTALVTMNRDAGHRARAAQYARRLLDLMPEEEGLRRLLDDLES